MSDRNLHESAISIEGSDTIDATEIVEYYILVENGSGLIDVKRTPRIYKSTHHNRRTMGILSAYAPSTNIDTWGFYEGNGLGALLTASVGKDTCTKVAGSIITYLHTITFEDNLPQLTIWDKDLNIEQCMGGALTNKCIIRCEKDNPISLFCEYFGSSINICNTFGTATYISESNLSKVIVASQNVVTYGVESTNVLDIEFEINNDINISEGPTQGTIYTHGYVPGKNRTITGKFSVYDESGEVIKSFWEGSTNSPTALTPSERPGYVSLQCKWTGAEIGDGFNYYLDISIPSIQITGVSEISDSNRTKYDITFEAVKTSDTPITILLQNTESVTYYGGENLIERLIYGKYDDTTDTVIKVTTDGKLQIIDDNSSDIKMGVDGLAQTTPTAYNISIVAASTQYSQALLLNTRAIEFRSRDKTDVIYSFTTGKVAGPTANYLTLDGGLQYYKEGLNLTSKTLYVAGAAGDVVELLVWS